MIVGARWDNERANNAGAAYVFERESGDLWEQAAKLIANDGQNSDYFGSDVGVSGDWAVVGASGYDRRRGAAYVFQRSGESWQQRQKIIPGGSSARSVFGGSVSIDAGYMAVGAPDHFKSGSSTVRSGAVFVYALNGGNWSQQSFIQPGTVGSVDYFGHAVAIKGNLLAMSAPGDGQLRGEVYIYRRDGSNWVQQQRLTPGDGSVGDGFGLALSMDADWLAVGSPHDDISVSNQGSVYLYRRNGNSFSFEGKVTAADPRVSQMFGFSVSVVEGNLLVGAPGDRRGAGSAYRFERGSDGRWRQQVKLTPEVENRRSAYGRSVGMGAADLVISATGDSFLAGQPGQALQSGTVYSLGGGGVLRQGFQSIETSFASYRDAELSFADADGDGDLDLAVYGINGGDPRLRLYLNDGDEDFSRSHLTFDPPANGHIGWTDIDNNGSMDLIVTGDFAGTLRTDVYLNGGTGTFTRVDLGLPGLKDPEIAWGDYDSDGDRDVLMSGRDAAGQAVLALYEHKAGHTFEAVDLGLPVLEDAKFSWGDYDNDSRPDILLSGRRDGEPVADVYRNLNNGFKARGYDLGGIAGSVNWVDFTSDGLLDAFVCGTASDGVPTVKLFRNTREDLVDANVSLPPVESCSNSWGDFDNDGDDDLALSGTQQGVRITDVYENTGDGFEESRFKLSRVAGGGLKWLDFDRDGRLDLAVAGQTEEDGHVLEIYKNSVGFSSNEVPTVPENLRADFDGSSVVLRWSQATDDRTPGAALTYNLRVGSSSGGIDVLVPNTTRNGHRTLSEGGNVGHSRKFTLSGLADGIYYWSVQAVDDAFGASEFAPEGSFIVGQSPQDFHDINANITGVAHGSSSWVDFRNSKSLDILVTGRNDRGPFTGMYRYRPSQQDFVPTDVSFENVEASQAAFGDYDNDEDMDVALIGMSESGRVARIYRNDGSNRVVDISAPILPVSDGAIRWADLDNDGDQDLIVTGHDGSAPTTVVYKNNRHDEFETASVSLARLSDGSIDAADYDGDHDIDLLVTGFDGTTPRSILYRNDGFPRFSQARATLVGVRDGSGTFGDYDGDGDVDILITGKGIDGPTTQLYENRGSEIFEPVETPLPNLEHSAAAWGDYDNNGKMDVLLSGSRNGRSQTSVFRYMGSKTGFQLLPIVDLPATQHGSVAAGDFDRDGRLDMLVTGEGGFFPTARVIQNQVEQWENTPPSRPTGVSYRLDGNRLHIFWLASQDAETPSSSLSYDLRISTTRAGADVMAPNTHPNGSRISASPGNVGNSRRWTIIDPPVGRLTVSVHAVDGGYMASIASRKLTIEIGEDQSSFETSDINLPGLAYGQATWADLDEDGDPDISIVGGSVPDEISVQFLNNGSGRFFSAPVSIPALAHATTVWGDYDNDGDDDLYISGEMEDGPAAYILRNDTGLVFIDIRAPLEPVELAAASWADYDGDGDDDLIVSGLAELGPKTILYKNNGRDRFVATNVELPAVFKASHDWADYDGDGDLDLLLTGSDGVFPQTEILENRSNGNFRRVNAGLAEVFDGTGDWVDLEGDGDLDVVITGHSFDGVVSKTFINTGSGTFFEASTTFPGIRISSTSWGDFDGDGDSDVAMAGWDGAKRVTTVFENIGSGTFSELYTGMIGISAGSVSWADADLDGDLDLLVGGASEEMPVTNVYLFDASLGSGKGGSHKTTTALDAEQLSSELPLPEDGFLFKPSYPNPFASRSTVQFAVGRAQHVRVVLYNVIGQQVDTPYEGTPRPNEMTTVELGSAGLASGAYFLRIEGDSFADTQKIIVNK